MTELSSVYKWSKLTPPVAGEKQSTTSIFGFSEALITKGTQEECDFKLPVENVMSIKEHILMNTHPERTVYSTNVIGHNYTERSYLTIVCN